MTLLQVERLGEKLIRMAYDLERDAARLNEGFRAGQASEAKAISSSLGALGRALRDAGK